jgi:hypothetical protein
MDKKVNNILLGILGEKIVANFLRKKGYSVEESLDIFDSSKDMQVNDSKVEVKTQTPLIVYDSFAINENQLNKILGCKYVFWVTVPLSKFSDEYAGCVFCMDVNDPTLKYDAMTLKSGRRIIKFPRKQSAMKNVYRITDVNVLKQMKNLSTSYL